MLAGDPFNKAPTDVASFTCHINEGFIDSLAADNFNFDRDCPYGMKTELFFPPCWDGYNLYKSDGSHMAYPSQNARDGRCPWTHPIRLPAIQLEYTWRTSYYNPGTVLNGHLAWANGDTTSYGIHGDFVNGWDLDVVPAAPWMIVQHCLPNSTMLLLLPVFPREESLPKLLVTLISFPSTVSLVATLCGLMVTSQLVTLLLPGSMFRLSQVLMACISRMLRIKRISSGLLSLDGPILPVFMMCPPFLEALHMPISR